MACCDEKIGPGQNHCAGCCRTFGTISGFDSHQRQRRAGITCTVPDGLVRDRWGTYRTPEEAAAVEARVDKMKAARRK